MKGFNIGLVESSIQTTPEVSVDDTANNRSPPGAKMARIARLATRKAKKGRWSHIVEATKHARAAFSRSRSEDSLSSQGSSEHPSRMGCSSRNGSSSSSNGLAEHTPERVKKSTDLPAKRSLFARKFGNLALSTSKIRLAFLDSEKTAAVDSHCFKNRVDRVGDSSTDGRGQAQRTVSAPFGQWLGTKSTSMDHLGYQQPHCLTPARSLSPIPSCASSNVPTPRSSITGQHETGSQKGSILESPGSEHQQIAQNEAKVFIPGSFGIETVNYSPTTGWI